LNGGRTVAEEHEDGFTPLILAKPDDRYDIIHLRSLMTATILFLDAEKIVPSCIAFRYADNK